MYLSGVDILTAMQQPGHADIKTTLAIYSHLDKKFKRKSIASSTIISKATKHDRHITAICYRKKAIFCAFIRYNLE